MGRIFNGSKQRDANQIIRVICLLVDNAYYLQADSIACWIAFECKWFSSKTKVLSKKVTTTTTTLDENF